MIDQKSYLFYRNLAKMVMVTLFCKSLQIVVYNRPEDIAFFKHKMVTLEYYLKILNNFKDEY